jgi:hypothetical protein
MVFFFYKKIGCYDATRTIFPYGKKLDATRTIFPYGKKLKSFFNFFLYHMFDLRLEKKCSATFLENINADFMVVRVSSGHRLLLV